MPTIEERELDILQTISYKVGAPTVKEFLDRFCEEIGEKELTQKKFKRMCMYLAKLTCYDYDLMQLPASLLAYAVLSVALKIHAKGGSNIDVASIMSGVLSFAQLNIVDAKMAAKEMLSFVKNFEKQYPSFKNLRIVYNEEFKSLRPLLGDL